MTRAAGTRLAVVIALAAMSACGASTGSSGHGGASGATGPGAGGHGGVAAAGASGHGGASGGGAGGGGTTGVAGAGASGGSAGKGGVGGAGGSGGSGGLSGTAGSGGSSGAGGTGGAAGLGGAGGSTGGASGTGGAGTGGASAGGSIGGAGGSISGAGGAAGGAGGSAGTGATAGTGGLGGSAGAGGAAGVGGTGGRFSCSSQQNLDCSGALLLPDGHVTTFSPLEWNPAEGKFCDAGGLRGAIFSYAGPQIAGIPSSSSAQSVDAVAGNFLMRLTAAPGGYAGGGITFDRCVDVSAWTAIRFTAWLASGDQTGCPFKTELQTFDQRPWTQSPPGGCDPNMSGCYAFPTAPSITLTPTPTPFTLPFSSFTGVPHAMPIAGQIVGLQWELDSAAAVVDGGPQTACDVEVRVDDIDFVAP